MFTPQFILINKNNFPFKIKNSKIFKFQIIEKNLQLFKKLNFKL